MEEERLRKEREEQIAILKENVEAVMIQIMEKNAEAQRVQEEKEKFKEELMEEERLRKEKEEQIAIFEEKMESLHIQNMQEVETIKREVEDRLNFVTEGAKILKQEKEDMEVKIDWLEILVMQIDDIVKQQKREILRREEESTRLNKELIEERRIRKQTESEVESLRREIKTLKQRLLTKTGQIGYTQKVGMELADLMNQLEDEINSDE
ncbi:uncharacterized protein PF3D7_1120000-like [Palaemon carinicauda]|uniref:uncharacterized protein PF3D7_1120000-like n=1 Tax=Palaemon carinicauda TaxID=392227 RepID=UPI0035B5DFC1